MANFVRTLKRAVSSGKDEQASPPPLARSATIAASPSFSDFSLNTHSDVHHEYIADQSPVAAPRRSSLEEFLPSSPRWLRSPMVFRGAPQPTASINIPHAAGEPVAAKPLEQAQTLPPRRREGKIGGMDYYDYCELIRSSSL